MGDAAALGLGELRSRSFLGEHFTAEVDVLTSGKEAIDPSCFRLRSPSGDGELPWLRRGTFSLRPGKAPVLELRSGQPLREPVLQVGIVVGCGYEVQRDYVLLLSPRGHESAPVPTAPVVAVAPTELSKQPSRRSRAASAPAEPAATSSPSHSVVRERQSKLPRLADRLVLSGDKKGEAVPFLRIATELAERGGDSSAREAQREVLRLEFRLLTALHDQATSQLSAAEKLRNMEETLAALRSRTENFAGRIEKGGAPTAGPRPVPVPLPVAPGLPADKSKQPEAKNDLLSEWAFYGALLGAVLGVGGWLGWQQYRQRQQQRLKASYAGVESRHEPSGAASPIMAAAAALPAAEPIMKPEERPSVPVSADIPSEPGEEPSVDTALLEDYDDLDDDLEAAAAGETVDERFEANPVMELAEIMLSFGRVKGAAQALQEYIDNNPQEALQPWIRLMDVYRMAGMREEFERLSHNLNQHFNVEIQQWESGDAMAPAPGLFNMVLPSETEGLSFAQPDKPKKAFTLEDIEHIRKKLTEIWDQPDCREYLDCLLRDNRGGQRNGFTLQVVDEILFLIELQETRAAMNNQTTDGVIG